MCLIVFALNAHPRYRLLLAANRDEFHDRPAVPAAWWGPGRQVLSGRDGRAGGTWLGLARSGRIAAVTNFRQGEETVPADCSRGLLVTGYLAGDAPPAAYAAAAVRDGARYGGFNLITGDVTGLYVCSNRGEGRVVHFTGGVHGISNGTPDCPWPKVQAARERLAALLATGAAAPGTLFALMADRTVWPDDSLPDTGVGLERERFLSPLFIAAAEYGTRTTTVVMVEHGGRTTCLERTFGRAALVEGDREFTFDAAGEGM